METSHAVRIFAALAQESRLAAMRLLIAQGPDGLAAGALAARLGVPASTASFHLAALEHAGLVVAERQGRQVIYAVRLATVRALLVFLTEACCAGRPELSVALSDNITRLLPGRPEETIGMTPAFNVLFLCTRNSARSILAEAILAQVGKGRFRAWSAGSDPAAAPMPEVIEKLRALGHDVAGLHCKSWDAFTRPDAPRMDFVIALCDTLHNQACPDFGDRVITGSWPMPDPAKFAGNDAERATLLNELYASLRRRIDIFVSLPFAALDRMALRARLDEIGTGARAGVPAGAGR